MKRACLILALLALWGFALAQNQPLAITSPNGGESWALGSTHAVTWTSVNLSGGVTLALIGVNSTTPQLTIATNIPVQQGVFQWTIPAAIIPGSYYKVKVFMPSPAGTMLQDLSDAPFSITPNDDPPPPQTFITVLSPNGGEQWVSGSTQTIAWSYGNLEGEVRVTLVQGPNTPQIVVAESVPIAAGMFTWTIPATIPSGQYMAHVQWLGIPAVYWGDVSDGFFTITNGDPPPPPGLTVLSPNGGETWAAGTMHPITWDYYGNDGMVMIQLMGGPEMTPINIIAPGVPAHAGIFHWNIPPYQMPGNAYQVQISLLSADGTYISDISDGFFNIASNNPPPPAGIDLLSPDGGEVWLIGEVHTIQWASTQPAGMVSLSLLGLNDPAAFTMIIAENIPAGQSVFPWMVPDIVPPGNGYRVAATLVGPDGVASTDISAAPFSILVGEEPPPQELAITSPNGGEQWVKGSWHYITWTDTNIGGNVRLALIYGQPPPYRRMVIARHAPNTGSFRWRVPYRLPVGDYYKVVVKGVNGATDTSDAFFSILTPNVVVKAAPNPTRQGTVISFDLDAPATATVRIYNIKGQCVRILLPSQTVSGPQNILWDGNDAAGRKVSAGIYFARVTTPDLNLTRKIIMLK